MLKSTAAMIFASLLVVPKDSVYYVPEQWTQSVFRVNDRPTVRFSKITELEAKWHQSGGLSKDISFTSLKFKKGDKPAYRIEKIQVLNSYGYFQGEIGLTRVYPDGTRFDDLLFNEQGKLFEHRVREKKEGRWRSRVESSDLSLRPEGYTGLNGKTCASCHDQAGTGGYAAGLVPGGDTVLSDPMEWDRLNRLTR